MTKQKNNFTHKILLITFDAMTHDRSYRKAMSKEAAVAEIINNAGTQFDPEVVRVFVEKVLNKSCE